MGNRLWIKSNMFEKAWLWAILRNAVYWTTKKELCCPQGDFFSFFKAWKTYYFRLRGINSSFLSWNRAVRQRNLNWLLQALTWLFCPFCPDVLVAGMLFYRHLHNEGRFSEARYKNTLQLQIPLIVLKQGSELRQWKILLFTVPEGLCEQNRNMGMCWFWK